MPYAIERFLPRIRYPDPDWRPERTVPSRAVQTPDASTSDSFGRAVAAGAAGDASGDTSGMLSLSGITQSGPEGDATGVSQSEDISDVQIDEGEEEEEDASGQLGAESEEEDHDQTQVSAANVAPRRPKEEIATIVWQQLGLDEPGPAETAALRARDHVKLWHEVFYKVRAEEVHRDTEWGPADTAEIKEQEKTGRIVCYRNMAKRIKDREISATSKQLASSKLRATIARIDEDNWTRCQPTHDLRFTLPDPLPDPLGRLPSITALQSEEPAPLGAQW